MAARLSQGLRKKLVRLETLLRSRPANPVLELLRREPGQLMLAAGMTPDSWQQNLLNSNAERVLMLASRQAGKSSVAAALALRTALLQPRSPVLLLSPTLRQSGEIFRKVLDVFNALGRPVAVTAESALRLELANGSRIISLPGTEGTVRGYSGVAMLIIDEAARVDDPLYFAVRPMLAVSQGRLVALSTPFGKRGWFYEEWSGTGDWERVKITARECPRISPQFLAEEKRALGERWFLQEFECSFQETIDAVFSAIDIAAALSDDIKPLFVR
jgi:hypothetical protein